MKTFGGFLTNEKMRRNIPFEDLFVVARELDQNAVAIWASNVFAVTYPMVAQVRLVFHVGDNELLYLLIVYYSNFVPGLKFMPR